MNCGKILTAASALKVNSALFVVRSDGASQDLQSGLQGIDEGLV
jgi:hypothetical protein